MSPGFVAIVGTQNVRSRGFINRCRLVLGLLFPACYLGIGGAWMYPLHKSGPWTQPILAYLSLILVFPPFALLNSMVAFSFLVVPFFVVLVGALPNQPQAHTSSRDLCGPLVSTPIGTAQGTIPIKGISRFAVRYASAQRWQTAQVATEWELPYVQSV